VYSIFTPLAQGQWRNVVSADLFELVDFKGVPRARLGLSGGDQSFTYLYLMDSSGRTRLKITVSPGDEKPEIRLLDTRGKPISDLSSGVGPSSGGLSALQSVAEPGGKADSAHPADIQNLQHQIDEIRLRLNSTIDRVNSVSP
jgi:hypothetical protein